MNVVFLLEVDILLLVDDGMERGRLFQNSIEGFFTGIHTLNWVQTKGGSEHPIQKEWVWWRRIHLVYIFESEGVSPFHFNLWQHHHISFYKNRAHKKLFTPLAFDDSMYLVLRLFQFDRLHEEGPQRFFCKFYVNFSDKKDSNEKKIQFSKRLDVFIDIVSQYFGRCSFFSILKKDNYIFFWKKEYI